MAKAWGIWFEGLGNKYKYNYANNLIDLFTFLFNSQLFELHILKLGHHEFPKWSNLTINRKLSMFNLYRCEHCCILYTGFAQQMGSKRQAYRRSALHPLRCHSNTKLFEIKDLHFFPFNPRTDFGKVLVLLLGISEKCSCFVTCDEISWKEYLKILTT